MVVLLYSTCKNEEEAEKIACALVQKKLVACVNYFPCKSVFIWKGEFGKKAEVVLFAKTTQEKVLEIGEEIKRLHSYEIPCVCFYESLAENPEFGKWVEESVLH